MEFQSSLALLDADTSFLLEKRITLLEAIERVGSINKAAKEVPMSYKSAWEAVYRISNLCPSPVVTKETGGQGGGGATLTPYGKNLIRTYTFIKEENRKFLEKLTQITDFKTGALTSLKRISVEISARNQIQGIIDAITTDGVNASILIRIKSDTSIQSVITHQAYLSLNLKEGDEITAIFKSSSVLLSRESSLLIGTQNSLLGRISHLSIGDVTAEVTLDIGKETITSLITAEAVKKLDLKVSQEVLSLINPSDVMIGK